MESIAVNGIWMGKESGNAYDVHMAHDQFVLIEEASTGEAGMRTEWGIAESPFGLCSLGWNSRGVCHLAFHDQNPGFPAQLKKCLPRTVLARNDNAAKKRIREIFAEQPAERIPVFLCGTAFQLKVWRALALIPRGSVTTYSTIASAIGSPGAARAVGTACGANPVAWLIPCHRVIRATGAAGGYRWGNERKRSMLAAETCDS